MYLFDSLVQDPVRRPLRQPRAGGRAVAEGGDPRPCPLDVTGACVLIGPGCFVHGVLALGGV